MADDTSSSKGVTRAPSPTPAKTTTTKSTGVSTGQGAQDKGSSSSKSSASASKSAASASKPSTGTTSAPGKTDKNPQTSNTAAKSDKIGTSTVSKTPASAGIRTPAQQAAVNKQKQAYTDYGGAYTTVPAPKTVQSVKVTDPSRGIASSSGGGPNRGLAGTSTTKTAAGKTDNASKELASAPGKTARQSPAANVAAPTRSLTGSATSTAWGGIAPQKPAPGKTSNPAGKVSPSATDTAWAGGPTNPAKPAPGKVDKQATPIVARPSAESLMRNLGISPGATTTGLMRTPGMTPNNPMTRSGMSFGDPLGVTDPARSLASAFVGDPQRDLGNIIAGTRGPSALDPTDTRTVNELSRDPTNLSPADLSAPRNLLAGVPTPKDVARIAAPSAVGNSPASLIDQARQAAFGKIAQARGQMPPASTPVSVPGDPPQPGPSPVPAPVSLSPLSRPGYSFPSFTPPAMGGPAYPGGDGITPNDIGGVFNNGTPHPTSDESVAMPVPAQPTVPGRGTVSNPFRSPPGETANDIMTQVALALGPRPIVPQRQPTQISVPGGGLPVAGPNISPSQQGGLGAQGGLGVQAYPGAVATPPLNVPSGSSTEQRDHYYGGGLTAPEAPATPPDQASPLPPATGLEGITQPSVTVPTVPSQEGNWPADPNFTQDDGQPQSLRELHRRYQYEKEQAKQGIKDLPGKLWQAIVNGDIHGGEFSHAGNGRQDLPRTAIPTRSQAPLQQTAQSAALAQLLLLLQQQQAGTSPSQMDLVFKTFV